MDIQIVCGTSYHTSYLILDETRSHVSQVVSYQARLDVRIE